MIIICIIIVLIVVLIAYYHFHNNVSTTSTVLYLHARWLTGGFYSMLRCALVCFFFFALFSVLSWYDTIQYSRCCCCCCCCCLLSVFGLPCYSIYFLQIYCSRCRCYINVLLGGGVDCWVVVLIAWCVDVMWCDVICYLLRMSLKMFKMYNLRCLKKKWIFLFESSFRSFFS
jgi:hypothetical protein